MQHLKFYKVFLDFLSDIFDAENQIVKSLPLMIQHSTHEDLKKGLTDHLEETHGQVKRLVKIFELLKESPQKKQCKGMAGLIEEGKEILEMKDLSPSLKDCFIIICAQKIEHYEIASYGSAIALIKHIKNVYPDNGALTQICNLLEESLKEEGAADKKLTKAAEGKIFCDGVNEELEEELKTKA